MGVQAEQGLNSGSEGRRSSVRFLVPGALILWVAQFGEDSWQKNAGSWAQSLCGPRGQLNHLWEHQSGVHLRMNER